MRVANQDNYELLIGKLREFKRKFYLNEMLKGAIWFCAVLLVSYLLVTVLEYFGRFNTGTRTTLFYTFIGVNLLILARYILMPLLSLVELRKALSYDQAASIIGQHFGEVKDKLLNTLQLHQQAATVSDTFQQQLIAASIDQKIQELKPVPFVRAVDYRANRKYLKYALIPLAVVLILLLQAPNMLLESTQRLVHHSTYYEEMAPFEFILQNDSMTGIRNQDFTVQLKIKGSELPAEAFLLVDGNPFRMNGKSKTEWNYTLHNLQKDMQISFNASGYTSRPYTLRVLPRPSLQRFDVFLHYPAYIGKKDENLQNVGDLTIPAGTEVSWKFYADNTDQIQLSFKDHKTIMADRKAENTYTFRKRFMSDDSYYLHTANRYLRSNDSIQYMVNVIPDAYPDIRMDEELDSVRPRNRFFSGDISDDYGFRRVSFSYHYTKSDDTAKMRLPLKTQNITFSPNKLMQPIYYFWDFSGLDIKPGDELEYYFEVWDNDGVNGSKSSRSQKFYFKAPSIKEIEQQTASNNQQMENDMESVIRQASQLQKDMEDTRMRLINKKNLDWQDQKALDDLLKRQDQLQNQVQQLDQQYDKNLQQQTEFKPMDPQLMEKHKELEDLMNQVLDDKTKKMFEELKKLMEQQNKEDIQKQLDQMKFDDKQMQKEMDRMLELFKQLEFEQKLDETINKLDDLKQQQDELSKEAQEKGKDASQDLKEKQKELQQKFDDVQKNLDELQKKNDELENKNNMENTDQQQQDIKDKMQQSQQNLDQQQNKKASEKMQDASQEMEQMSNKLKQMQQDMQKQTDVEDYQTLRQILENLVYVSMEQEKLMDEFKTVNQYNPKYVELAKRQQELKGDSKIIEDSLLALSKRAMQIKSYVNKEIGEINFNMDKSIQALADRDLGSARADQQFTMTHINNLALMLSEVMQNMQQQMMSSSGNCKGGNCKGSPKPKPGQGQGQGMSMQKLRELQDQLNKEMEGLKQGMQQGTGQNQLSKELAQMAAQQEMLRHQLEKLSEELSKNGKGSGDLKNIQNMMDKTEEDLYNKRITDETIKRQKDITVRLLQSEKAQKQQEFDDQRQSKTADQKTAPSAPLLEKYLKAKQAEAELLRTVPPALNPYYREKVKTYFEGTK